MSDAAARCVRNSLHWYEAVFRAHRLSGEIVDGVWVSHNRPPPYHSNAMTLEPSPVEAQVATLRELRSELTGSWSIKDSFAALDLVPLGFAPLFDAAWICRDPAPLPASSLGVEAWRQVTTIAELEPWETAWRDNGSPADRPVFVPALLADPALAVFGAYRDDTLVAGCAANRSADAVGFSNFFVADGDDERLAAGAVAAVGRFGQGRPIVGYESGTALDRARRIGFEAVGPLRVWETIAT
jgi:hypothetical protein